MATKETESPSRIELIERHHDTLVRLDHLVWVTIGKEYDYDAAEPYSRGHLTTEDLKNGRGLLVAPSFSGVCVVVYHPRLGMAYALENTVTDMTIQQYVKKLPHDDQPKKFKLPDKLPDVLSMYRSIVTNFTMVSAVDTALGNAAAEFDTLISKNPNLKFEDLKDLMIFISGGSILTDQEARVTMDFTRNANPFLNTHQLKLSFGEEVGFMFVPPGHSHFSQSGTWDGDNFEAIPFQTS